MHRVVLDTNILVHTRRSLHGSSKALLPAVDGGKARMLVSVPLFLEYEAVLTSPEQLSAGNLSSPQVNDFLDDLAGLAEPVRLHYLWRPQASDVAGEMVLETAVSGLADRIVTFNRRHLAPAVRFGTEVIGPGEALRRIT